MSKAWDDIKAERQRQIDKGHDAAKDDQDHFCFLSDAGTFYAHVGAAMRGGCTVQEATKRAVKAIGYPWGDPHSIIKDTSRDNLIRAIALLIAEVERGDRDEEKWAAL